MSIVKKVKAVEKVFADLESATRAFQQASGLGCLSGCGMCCKKPDIEASVLEMLPLAFHYFLEGKAAVMLQEIEAGRFYLCPLFQPLIPESASGFCRDYDRRGLICRLFGFAARRNKYGELELATCGIIKTELTATYHEAIDKIRAGLPVPVYSDYYRRLMDIDFRLGQAFFPIQEALAHAIREVMHYYAYRPHPRRWRKAA